MDPQACLEYMFSMQHSGDTNAYNECKADLVTWLRNGGFGPKVAYRYSPFIRSLAPSADGREGVLVALTYTGEATIRWRNGRRSTVRLSEVDAA